MDTINIFIYRVLNKIIEKIHKYFNSPKRRNAYTSKLIVQKRRSYFLNISKHINFLHALDLVNKSKLDGTIVELGVLNGNSLAQIYALKQYLGLSNDIYAFDTFEDSHSNVKFSSNINIFKAITIPNLIRSGIEEPEKEIKFIIGDIRDTLGEFKEKIALLHVDVDLPEVYEFILNTLWSQLEVESVIIFDDIFTDKLEQERVEAKFGNLTSTVENFLTDKDYELIGENIRSRMIIRKLG